MFREKVASHIQKAWSNWMKYLFSKCTLNEDGTATIPVWAVKRWQRQVTTPYEDLPEQEKDTDRREADKVIEVFAHRIRTSASALDLRHRDDPAHEIVKALWDITGGSNE